MENNKVLSLIGGVVFLLLAAVNLWRLLVGFPIVIGGYVIGQTISFFAFAAFAALSLMFFRASRG